jgi:hypothetical protein
MSASTPGTQYPRLDDSIHMIVPARSSDHSEATESRSEPAKPVDANHQASRREEPLWLRALLRFSLYFSIYVFSLGPMYWHWWEGKYMNGSRLVAAFYEPLLLLSGWIPPLGWFVNSYVHVWVFDLQWTL